MSILLVLFLIVIFFEGFRYSRFNNEYISRDTTKQINGIFVFLILLSHLSSYIELKDEIDILYLNFKDFLLQLVVVTFLFYSGYGIMESIKKKGNIYVKTLPRRCLQLLVQFDFIVLIFILLGILTGKNYDLNRIFLSLLSWESVGNSNWYVFIILSMYLITFISFTILKNNDKGAIVLSLFLSIFLLFVLQYLKFDQTRYYNTFLCYNLGMIYSMIKVKIEYLMKNYLLLYYVTLLITIICFINLIDLRVDLFYYHIHTWLFCLIIVLISMKFRIQSKILSFFGNHVFSIYMLQRIPMIIFSYYGLNNNKFVFIALSIFITLLIAVLFDNLYHRNIEPIIFSQKF